MIAATRLSVEDKETQQFAAFNSPLISASFKITLFVLAESWKIGCSIKDFCMITMVIFPQAHTGLEQDVRDEILTSDGLSSERTRSFGYDPFQNGTPFVVTSMSISYRITKNFLRDGAEKFTWNLFVHDDVCLQYQRSFSNASDRMAVGF